MPMILDWYPDYWTPEERDQLFDFWRYRYARNPWTLSPSGSPAGGVGLFDAVLMAMRFPQAMEKAVDKAHPLNLAFQERQQHLAQEYHASQPVDQHRLTLLIVAEEASWAWWKALDLAKTPPLDRLDWGALVSPRIARYKALYQDALAQLIEYDREHGHPLADPDRDVQQHPVTVNERRRWLTRKGRALPSTDEDAQQLIELLKEDGLRQQSVRSAPQPRAGFVPIKLEQWHERRVVMDHVKGIVRSKSGRLSQQAALEKPPAPLVISRAGAVDDKVQRFRAARSLVRPSHAPDLGLTIEPVASPAASSSSTKNSPVDSGSFVPPPPPPFAFEIVGDDVFSEASQDDLAFSTVQENTQASERSVIIERDDDALELGVIDVAESVPDFLDVDPLGEDDESDDEGNKGRGDQTQGGEEEQVDEENEARRQASLKALEQEIGATVASPELTVPLIAERMRPSWMPHDEPINIVRMDPARPTVPEGDLPFPGEQAWTRTGVPKESMAEAYRAALKDSFAATRHEEDGFDREQKLQQITEKWRARNLAQLSEEAPSTIWDRASQKVEAFKAKAQSLWAERVTPTLGLETPQQRLAARRQMEEKQDVKLWLDRAHRLLARPTASIAATLSKIKPPSIGRRR